jgi:hypothetical protein
VFLPSRVPRFVPERTWRHDDDDCFFLGYPRLLVHHPDPLFLLLLRRVLGRSFGDDDPWFGCTALANVPFFFFFDPEGVWRIQKVCGGLKNRRNRNCVWGGPCRKRSLPPLNFTAPVRTDD